VISSHCHAVPRGAAAALRSGVLRTLLIGATVAGTGCDAGAERAADPARLCTEPRTLGTLPDPLADASGVAISRSHPGILWMHNNTEPQGRIFAVDSTGSIRATLQVPGTRNIDWEDIALAPCTAGHCLYVADIGDNYHRRADIAFFRIPEPRPSDSLTAAPEWFPIRYPEGPQDAEALFVMPGEQVYIITKGRNRPVSLYRYPLPLQRDVRVEMELVQELTDGIVQLPDMITGADATLDGTTVAVRSYAFLWLYTLGERGLVPLLEPPRVDLRPLAEPQGEGVAIRDDGWIVLNGERGVNASPAPLAALTCPPDLRDDP